PLGSMHRDDIAASHAMRAQRIRELVARGPDLPPGVGRAVTLIVLVVQGDTVLRLKRAIQAIDSDVVVGRDLPAMSGACLGERLRTADRLLLESNHSST